MLRPRKMKFIELTVLKSDMDAVIEYLGKHASMQFSEPEGIIDSSDAARIRETIDRLLDAAVFIGAEHFNDDNSHNDENVTIPSRDDEELLKTLCDEIEKIKDIEYKTIHEKQRIRETINEARAFSKMNVPFSDFEHLSYLTLRLGRLDPKEITELRETLGDRAVIIPLDNENRFLAASSKKGRFALDSTLKKLSFEPITVPENYRGIPAEMTKSLNEQLINLDKELEKIKKEKEALREKFVSDYKRLISLMNTALVIEGIKAKFSSTESLYHFSGWTPADTEKKLVKDLSALTKKRVAVHSYLPHEVPSIKNGTEKVPVSMKHSAFVKGFEGIVFSYGAPPYGTIDPTPIVAFFFTLMFGIMFGDVGQGFILLLAGLLIKHIKKFAKHIKYSTPLISVGIASMIMGLLAGSVFTNEKLLVAPTRAVTEALFGYPMDHILHILPMAGQGGSITKLLYFFAFTVSIGIIINSLGLLINIGNSFILKRYQRAIFSKTGLAGLVLFWYAIFIAVRVILGGKMETYDIAGILIPLFLIFFGHIIWSLISKEKIVLKDGLTAFIMEGIVEMMDTVSGFFSNTVSFLRVGAFALAHAVFSFIVFYFTDELAGSGIAGTLSAMLILLAGNAIIIILEGLIVAIQVMRLQYYEFFNKFFIDTGVEFSPFRFKQNKI
ncbi:MAG: V-type ATP synthase subunit I [Treponema sp.]|nr:V-type ATP synthase subunit I [Treponema sp.]